MDAPLIILPLTKNKTTDYLLFSLGIIDLHIGAKDALENY